MSIKDILGILLLRYISVKTFPKQNGFDLQLQSWKSKMRG